MAGTDRERYATEILSHPEFNPFVSVLSLMPGETPTAIVAALVDEHRELLASLTDFYYDTLVTKKLPGAQTIAGHCGLSGFPYRVWEEVRFLQRKIGKIERKHHQNMIGLVYRLIDFLTQFPPTNDATHMTVNKDDLCKYALTHPSVIALQCYATFRASLFDDFTPILHTPEESRQELAQVIEFVGRAVDPRTAFFPMHPLQPVFEQLLMSDKLPFRATVNALVEAFPETAPAAFLAQMVDAVMQMLRELGISRKPNDAALILLFVRFIFDEVYEIHPFVTHDGLDIVGKLSDCTLAVLDPPAEFMPPFERDMKVVDVFRNDPFFAKSIEALEFSIFQTNGFDVLACVERSLAAIEKAAFHHNKGLTIVFPFEVTFGLFLGVVISSQIRNWEQIASLVDSYTPISGLCPVFEFSRAKIVASLIQLRQMVCEAEQGEL
jgi:hypothetical protein